MPEHVRIWLIDHVPEYARVLNTPEIVHSLRSLYEVLSNYRDRSMFRTLSDN